MVKSRLTPSPIQDGYYCAQIHQIIVISRASVYSPARIVVLASSCSYTGSTIMPEGRNCSPPDIANALMHVGRLATFANAPSRSLRP